MIASNLKESYAIFDLANKTLLASVYGYVKASAETITEMFGLTPIMYDDGNYSYSSLNLINTGKNWFIAPFELIDSVPEGN